MVVAALVALADIERGHQDRASSTSAPQAMRPIAERIAAGDYIVITDDGTGPQVGYMASCSRNLPRVIVAMVARLAGGRLAGASATIIQRHWAPMEAHGEKRQAAGARTKVEVDPESAQAPPTKPGASTRTGSRPALHAERGWTSMVEAFGAWLLPRGRLAHP